MQSTEDVSWVAVTRSSDGLDVTYTDAAPVTLSALVALRSSSEAFERAPHATEGYTLYLLEVDTVPGADDWFTVRGARYEVDGNAFRWGAMGVVINVKRAS